ncbi:MAG: hypothetical protein AB7O62_15500 [Pirellulales bacterium]
MMAAHATIHSRRISSGGVVPRPRVFARAGLVLLAFAAVLLLWRRIDGSLAAPAEARLLPLAAVGLAAMAAAVRWLNRGDGRPLLPLPVTGLYVCLSILLALAGAALSWPRQATAGTAGLWLVLIVAETLAWRRHWLSPTVRGPALFRPAEAEESLREQADSSNDIESAEEEPIEDPSVQQQFVRRTLSDGRESVQGTLRSDHAAGQRTAPLHLAFCPPLRQAPALEARQLDGPPARVRVVQSLPYGAKLEVKLDSAALGPATVRVAFFAVAEKPA